MSIKEEAYVRPEVICDALEKSLQEDGSVVMDEYLRAYKELSRFFHSLGIIFSFVAKDVDSKISILEEYRSDDKIGSHYETFQSMIEYEEKEDLLRDPKRPSGCRTVLRLHRALQFFSKFMEELAKVAGSSGTGCIARECYHSTLAQYHSWVIQKTASLAMYKLPNRDLLLAKSFGHDTSLHSDDTIPTKEDEEWKKESEEMLRLGQLSHQVFDSVQNLFSEKSLLDLP